MKNITVYTDGGVRGNGKENNIGAYAYYLEWNGNVKTFSAGERNTTNNIMEIKAAVEALKALKEPCEVNIHSDSAYLVNAINMKWIDGWKRNGWRRKEKNKFVELKNKELWMELYELVRKHKTKFIKVKGHSDCELNNLVDKLLNDEMDKMEGK